MQYLKQILQVVNYHLATYVDHLKIIIEGFLFVTFLRIVWGHKDSLKKVCLEPLLKNNLQLCRLKRYCLQQKKTYHTNIWPSFQPKKIVWPYYDGIHFLLLICLWMTQHDYTSRDMKKCYTLLFDKNWKQFFKQNVDNTHLVYILIFMRAITFG